MAIIHGTSLSLADMNLQDYSLDVRMGDDGGLEFVSMPRQQFETLVSGNNGGGGGGGGSCIMMVVVVVVGACIR